MTLFEKIKSIYPDIDDIDFANGVIVLQDDNNDKGIYLKEWNHPSLERPTDKQLASA